MGIAVRVYPYIFAGQVFIRSIKRLLQAPNYPVRLRWHILILELKFLLKLTLSTILQKELKEEAFLGYKVSFPGYLEFFILFMEIFGIQEYRYKLRKKSPLIIDGGSNWGMSVLYFKYFFPQAKIIAIEPNKQTAALLQSNLVANNIKGVTILNKMLAEKLGKHSFFVWQADTHWTISDTGVEEIIQNRADYQQVTVESVQLSQLLCKPVDLIKLDIEGVEGEVLDEAKENLDKVYELIIEYHGIMGDKENSLTPILQILKEKRFSYQIYNTKNILPHKEEKMLRIIHAVKIS